MWLATAKIIKMLDILEAVVSGALNSLAASVLSVKACKMLPTTRQMIENDVPFTVQYFSL